MSKYTNKQLKEMAWDTLYAYNMGDHRADALIMFVSQVTGLPPHIVLQKINELADMEITDEN